MAKTLLRVGALLLIPWAAQAQDAHYPKEAIKSDWKAKWIWSTADGKEPNTHVLFRKTFTLKEVPADLNPLTQVSMVDVSAATHYTLYVNGQRVGFGPPISDRRYHYFDTRNIATFLRKGPNVIAAHVYSLATPTEDFHGGRGLFILEGSVPRSDGDNVSLNTDGSWKFLVSPMWRSDTPRQSVQLHFVEVADLRKEPVGWNDVGFDDSAWAAAVEIGVPPQGGYEHLVRRDLGDFNESFKAPVKVVATGEVRRRASLADGAAAIDLKGCQWIWFPEGKPAESAPVGTRYFRHEVALPKEIASAVLTVVADNEYVASVNGVEAVRGGNFHFAQTADVTGLLTSGSAVVTVEAKNGGDAPNPAGLLARLTVKGADGKTVDLVTDKSWKVSEKKDGPWVDAAELGPCGMAPWGAVAVLGMSPAQEVQSEDLLPVETVKFAEVESVTTVATPVPGRDAVIVLDMGEQVIGCPTFEVEAAAGTVVDVSISEILKNGRVLAKRLIMPSGDATHLTDRITLRDGRQTWQRYDYNAYRYLQLTIRNAVRPLTIHRVGTTVREYSWPMEAKFACSDELFTRIFESAKRTHKVNTHWGYCGSGWREHAQWSDLVWPMQNCATFGESSAMRYYLHQTMLSQEASGRMSFPYPGHMATELPEQTMWLAEMLHNQWTYFADTQTLRDLLPPMVKANEWFRKHLAASGLMTSADWPNMWLVICWGYPFVNNTSPGELATLNLTYLKYLRDVQAVAAAIGAAKEEADFKAQADALERKINETFFAPEEDRYYEKPGRQSPSPFAATLAIKHGVVPADHREKVLQFALYPDLRAGKCSPWFMHDVLETFGATGRVEDGIRGADRYFGSFFKDDGSVFWELWNLPGEDVHPIPGYTAEMGALTIAYASSPASFAVRYVLGVRPLEPGFGRALIAPRYGGLEWARGIAPTPKGYVEIEWKGHELMIRVPEHLSATLQVPWSEAEPVVRLGGKVLYDGAAFQPVDGVSAPAKKAAWLELEVGGGTYEFASGLR